jgi:hypothetical protein
MTARIVRPSAKAMLRYAPLLPAVFIFAAGQLYLARLTPGGATGFAAIVLLAALAFTLGWLAFLRNARVCLESEDVTVFDWLGRVAFKAPRTDIRLESFAIRRRSRRWWPRRIASSGKHVAIEHAFEYSGTR